MVQLMWWSAQQLFVEINFNQVNGTGDFKLIKVMHTQHKIISATSCGSVS